MEDGFGPIIGPVITTFMWASGKRFPTRIVTGEIPDIPEGGWLWVDVAKEDPEVIRTVCSRFSIPERFIEDALAEGSLPLLEAQRDLIYVVLNAFRTTDGGRLAHTEVDLFIGPGFLLSISGGDVVSMEIMTERLQQGIGLSAPSPAGLLAHLAMVGSRRFPPLIDQLETQLDVLEEMALRADPRALTEVHALRRDLIVLRRVLVPQRQIYDELSEGAHRLVDEDSRREFERVTAYQSQILESLEAARSLLGSVFETHRGAIADQTNEIVRVLTVFSAILLPLALITGIWGMNFENLPLADHPAGFWITIGAMAVIALALWLYFGRRRFVGSPRLSEIPRSVGLGLYHIGTAPIRVVADGIGSTIRMVTGTPADENEDDQPD
jgi:magnesium transporter